MSSTTTQPTLENQPATVTIQPNSHSIPQKSKPSNILSIIAISVSGIAIILSIAAIVHTNMAVDQFTRNSQSANQNTVPGGMMQNRTLPNGSRRNNPNGNNQPNQTPPGMMNNNTDQPNQTR